MSCFKSFPFFTYIRSEKNARIFLQSAYERMPDIDAEKRSYQNAASFTYACAHGIQLLEQGKRSPVLTQPMLFYYACAHLMKGLILCVQPSYPSSTKDLAHGISTRKRKKRQYAFLQDEVRVQRHGLLPVAASSLFQTSMQANKTYSMQHLLAVIPEMRHLFALTGNNYVDQVSVKDDHVLNISKRLLDRYHLSIKGMIQKIKPYIPPITEIEKRSEVHTIYLQRPITKGPHPFFIERMSQKIFMPNRHSLFLVIDELLIHYMVLYNLSMIARYEVEWWGDTITAKSTGDFPVIQHFLDITAQKLPSIVHASLELITHMDHPTTNK